MLLLLDTEVTMNHRQYEQHVKQLRALVERRLSSLVRHNGPNDLYDACRYVIFGGGKRVRSTLVILACEAVGGKSAVAVSAGAAVELMHNFTLVHDDVMDNARSRRGKPTVHTKWDVNNALLVGDVLLGLAYQCLFETTNGDVRRMADVFTSGLVDVCEGQALDLEFERAKNVLLEDYFTMIEKKTGGLIAMSAELGGLVGGGSGRQVTALRRFGHFLGRAFQLQDDLLDVVANVKEFGKTIGGDIVKGKKTFLLLKAMERARAKDKRILHRATTSARLPEGKRTITAKEQRAVAAVTAIYKRYGVIESAKAHVRRDTSSAIKALAVLPETSARAMLQWYSELLVRRVS